MPWRSSVVVSVSWLLAFHRNSWKIAYEAMSVVDGRTMSIGQGNVEAHGQDAGRERRVGARRGAENHQRRPPCGGVGEREHRAG